MLKRFGKKQKILRTNYYEHGLHRWHSGKYTPGAESLLRSGKRTAGGIGLYVNADKAEYMYFNQRGDISTLKGGLLKLVDKFTYLESSVSSTENDINTQLAKSWTATDRLSV